jgi:hypothetical protein
MDDAAACAVISDGGTYWRRMNITGARCCVVASMRHAKTRHAAAERASCCNGSGTGVEKGRQKKRQGDREGARARNSDVSSASGMVALARRVRRRHWTLRAGSKISRHRVRFRWDVDDPRAPHPALSRNRCGRWGSARHGGEVGERELNWAKSKPEKARRHWQCRRRDKPATTTY